MNTNWLNVQLHIAHIKDQQPSNKWSYRDLQHAQLLIRANPYMPWRHNYHTTMLKERLVRPIQRIEHMHHTPVSAGLRPNG